MAIKCPKCQTDNPDTQKFCGECATPLHFAKDVSVTKTLETPVEILARGALFADRYEIIEELGSGGMGKVYRVEDKKIGEEVALKLIKPEISADKKTIERFRNELKIARKIRHKNVCGMFDLGEAEGTHFITMEYVRGEDLKSFINRSGQLAAGTAVRIAKQVCEGLSDAHKLGIVHRDLKSNNIMIDKAGNARIMDFGIARSSRTKGLTGEGIAIGTPEYMSPEQVEAKEVDIRSDIYSFGVILYEMVTGTVPFKGDTPLAIALCHKSELPKDPKILNKQIPEKLSQLILKCLEKKRENRCQHTNELISDLLLIEQKVGMADEIEPKRKTISFRTITTALKKRWIFFTTIFLLIAVFLFAVLFFINEKATIPSENIMLAVLPFENLGSAEDEYFADGITDEITNRLSFMHALDVISSTSASQYKNSSKSIHQIRDELQVDYIVTGTVRWEKKTGELSRVRISPKLIKTDDSTQIWNESFERDLKSIFAVQAEIAENVAKQLDIKLSNSTRSSLQSHPTDNLEAYDYYLSSKSVGIGKKIELLEKAIECDPSFVLAYIELSLSHSYIYHMGYDKSEERLQKSKSAVDKALELMPNLPEAKQALGYYYYRGFLDYERALELFNDVQKARPNISPFSVGIIHRRQGRLEDSLMALERSYKLSPRTALYAYELGATYFYMRNYDKALVWLNRSISINPNFLWAVLSKASISVLMNENTSEARSIVESLFQHPLVDYMLIRLDMIDRKFQEALDRLSSISYDCAQQQNFYFQKDLIYASIYFVMKEFSMAKTHADSARNSIGMLTQEHPDDPRFHAALGLANAYAGLKDEAIREGMSAIEILPVTQDAISGPIYVLNLAKIFTIVGELEKAFDRLDYLFSISIGGEFIWQIASPLIIQLDPQWDLLRNHHRFKELIEKYSGMVH